jgi:hypothetical protein
MSTTTSILAASLFAVILALPMPGAAAETDSPPDSTTPAAQIDALPPVGKGNDMVRPYREMAPVPSRTDLVGRGQVPRDRVNTPYSREIVPPGYRYGTPGYGPDGRGGRGYDFGYPGYRPGGGGGYPHQRW